MSSVAGELGEVQRLRQLGPIGALAALDLGEPGDDLRASGRHQIVDRLPLHLRDNALRWAGTPFHD